jgi:hypothetical protein
MGAGGRRGLGLSGQLGDVATFFFGGFGHVEDWGLGGRGWVAGG